MMQIEYEATFPNINKDEIRKRLKEAGAQLIRPEFFSKRVTFKFPEGHDIKGGWLRVRDEDGKITMSLKIVDGDKIRDQKEMTLEIDDFSQGVRFLEMIGCQKKAYQETKREIWSFDKAEIMIDEWPYLEPFIEIEGESEEVVKNVSEKLGFNYADALFCSVATLYKAKYGLSEEFINNQLPEITFDGKNPFKG